MPVLNTGLAKVSAAAAVWYGGRGVFCAGHRDGSTDVIDYVTIGSTGNATDFGDPLAATQNSGGVSNGTRGVFAGGGSSTDVIQYITISTTANTQDFGDLTVGRYGFGGCSNGSRGIYMGGHTGVTGGTMDYITIETTGDALDFGDLIAITHNSRTCNNETRGVAGGMDDANTIEYITMATTSNATNFGDFHAAGSAGKVQNPGGCDDTSDRGLFTGGGRPGGSNAMDYITISSTGNTTDFGDLTVARYGIAAVSNGSRGVFAGGQGNKDVIDYVAIGTTGNASDFGNLTSGRHGAGEVAGD